jgi:hypothetical protein
MVLPQVVCAFAVVAAIAATTATPATKARLKLISFLRKGDAGTNKALG